MPGEEPLDFEDIAIRQLAKRARSIHVGIGLVSAVLGVGAGQLLAWFVLATIGRLPGILYGGLFLAGLLISVYIGRDLARRIITRRSAAWSKEMAEQYQLNPAQLRQYIRHM